MKPDYELYFTALTKQVIEYHDYIEKMAKWHPFAKVCLNKLYKIIDADIIDFEGKNE